MPIENFTENMLRNQGYFHALLDINNWFNAHSETLKEHKMYNKNGIHSILQAMLNNQDVMQRFGEFTSFTLTDDKKVILSSKQEIDMD